MRLRSTPSPARGLFGLQTRLPALLAVLAVAAIAACSNNVDSNPAAIIDLTVPQHLASVNGTSVPFQELFSVYDGGLVKSDSQIYAAGVVTFNSDGSFQLTFTVRNKLFDATQTYSDQTVTTVWTGSWAVKGTTLTYLFTDSGVARTLTGTAGDGVSTIGVTSTVQTSATQSSVVTHTLQFAVQ